MDRESQINLVFTANRCWINGTLWTFLGPNLVILLVQFDLLEFCHLNLSCLAANDQSSDRDAKNKQNRYKRNVLCSAVTQNSTLFPMLEIVKNKRLEQYINKVISQNLFLVFFYVIGIPTVFVVI